FRPHDTVAIASDRGAAICDVERTHAAGTTRSSRHSARAVAASRGHAAAADVAAASGAAPPRGAAAGCASGGIYPATGPPAARRTRKPALAQPRRSAAHAAAPGPLASHPPTTGPAPSRVSGSVFVSGEARLTGSRKAEPSRMIGPWRRPPTTVAALDART